jgi:uncharacterized OsmC-like protein
MGVSRANDIPLEGIEVRLDPKIHLPTKGPDDPRHLQKRIAVIVRRLRLVGNLSDEQVAVLVEGAKSCPTENTLTHSTRIRNEVEVVAVDQAE